MLRHSIVRAAVPLLGLMLLPTAAWAAEPFHGFFQPRGGESYSPLHFWAPAAYRVKLFCHGPACGTPVSVYPPARGTVVATQPPAAPAPAKP